jgi:hypothetical protein
MAPVHEIVSAINEALFLIYTPDVFLLQMSNWLNIMYESVLINAFLVNRKIRGQIILVSSIY